MRHPAVHHTLAAVACIVLIVAFVNLLSGGGNLVIAGISAGIIVLLIIFEVRHYHPNVDRERRRGERHAP